MTTSKGARILQTIHAMVEMGPWRLNRIDYYSPRQYCEISNTPISWVYVMERLTDPIDTSRVGSECGPKLLGLSDEVWEKGTQGVNRSKPHVRDLVRLREFEEKYSPWWRQGEYEPGWAKEQLARIERGVSDHERRVMGSQVSQAMQAFRRAMRRSKKL